METSRRNFVKASGACLAALAGADALASDSHKDVDEDRMGVLVDLTLCVGCRRCEWACRDANGLPNEPLAEFDDTSVFSEPRRPSPNEYSVVTRTEPVSEEKMPIHLKVQCMHCDRPACVSACLVGALEKDPKGPVTYDASKCIGCRYCMVACPFQRLTYEFDEALTPRVRKCSFCKERTREGKLPACVEICPVEAMIYGRREELLEVAHDRIRRHPDTYVDHVYGETEVGGTSWLYLADRPFSEIGLPTLGPDAPSALTEKIQHGIFRGFAAPLLLAGLLAAIGRLTTREGGDA